MIATYHITFTYRIGHPLISGKRFERYLFSMGLHILCSCSIFQVTCGPIDNNEVLVLKWHCNNYLDNKFHSLHFFKTN